MHEGDGPHGAAPGLALPLALRTYISHLGGISRHVPFDRAGRVDLYHCVPYLAPTLGFHGKRNSNLLKYNYWRTAAPERDWIVKPDFDIATVDFSIGDFNSAERPSYRQQFRDCYDAAEMYAWLCGKHDEFELMGGRAGRCPIAGCISG